MAKVTQQPSDPVTDGPAAPVLTPPAPAAAKEAPKAVESPIMAVSAPATRYFKVAIPHNPPLIVKIEAPSNALNWGELAIKEFNRIRGVISTVHVHTVEDAEGIDG